jgi:hypothetical protein
LGSIGAWFGLSVAPTMYWPGRTPKTRNSPRSLVVALPPNAWRRRSPFVNVQRIRLTCVSGTASPNSSVMRPVTAPAWSSAKTTSSTTWSSASAMGTPGPIGRFAPWL